jgi:predicted nucleic acid-binding protein
MKQLTLYVETSALLRILVEDDTSLLGELSRADRLLASALTFVEAQRGLRRANREKRMGAAALREAQKWMRFFQRSCEIIALDDRILERAKEEFPVEPLRTLDAIHLASAIDWDEGPGPVTVLSVDDRVRKNVEALGLGLAPAST